MRIIYSFLYLIDRLIKPTFSFNCQKLFYQLNEKENVPETNERAIEIPLIKQFLAFYETKDILELGNVLSRFGFNDHAVVDKFEKAEGVINKDINNFFPKRKFNLIVSISTIEHIAKNPLIHLKKNCLNKGGIIAFTIPIGINTKLEKQVLEDKSIEKWFFVRRNKLNRWYQVFQSDINRITYNYPFANANAIIFGVIKK